MPTLARPRCHDAPHILQLRRRLVVHLVEDRDLSDLRALADVCTQEARPRLLRPQPRTVLHHWAQPAGQRRRCRLLLFGPPGGCCCGGGGAGWGGCLLGAGTCRRLIRGRHAGQLSNAAQFTSAQRQLLSHAKTSPPPHSHPTTRAPLTLGTARNPLHLLALLFIIIIPALR